MNYCTYILTNKWNNVLYTGSTKDLKLRIFQHRHKLADGFTARYNVSKLVWYRQFESYEKAFQLERKIKNRNRQWKIDLLQSANPEWKDLNSEWDFDEYQV